VSWTKREHLTPELRAIYQAPSEAAARPPEIAQDSRPFSDGRRGEQAALSRAAKRRVAARASTRLATRNATHHTPLRRPRAGDGVITAHTQNLLQSSPNIHQAPICN
jgi:hypothetical protein